MNRSTTSTYLQTDLTDLLDYIDPALCSYSEWVSVGMALKDAGYSPEDWDKWSQRDLKRYHNNECAKKWETFNGCTAAPVTAGTIVQMARDNGWQPERPSYELAWDDEIGARDKIVVDKNWIEGQDIVIPDKWDPAKQLITYLETLFDSNDNVGYVTEVWQKDEKYLPTSGCCDRTAGQLIEQLNKCKGDIGSVIGDCNPDAGAWIRFNPLDGKGVKNDNVTDFRYALVESDTMDIEKQNAIIRQLEMPVACLVYSGKKSLHAIVKIDAPDYHEYRKRVDYLYDVCKKNGLKIDSQNRNPSRLSRMPGVMRGEQKQYLLDTNIGKATWGEWKEWIDGINDSLPDPQSLADEWDNMPDLAPTLIDGVLRQGHKMLVAGPSKAGKSFALIELCCAIAEGKPWLGFNCAQGKVLYVNLELDQASCFHRFKDVYSALKWKPDHLQNIEIWNLRGKAAPMDVLTPKLIRRAIKKNFIAVIIDPIYKVITGDENSAEQMSKFCNQFDRVCTELGCAVIYCHHHSKGSQGEKKSADRVSGSGVFARDPDAMIDLIQLDAGEDTFNWAKGKEACRIAKEWLIKFGYADEPSQDDEFSEKCMTQICQRVLKPKSYQLMLQEIDKAKKNVENRTAWRIEGTLREFPSFKPKNLWFDYPIHKTDDIGVLEGLSADRNTKNSPWKENFTGRKTNEQRKNERTAELNAAFDACSINGEVTVQDVAEYLGVTERTIRSRIQEHDGYELDKGKIVKKTNV